MTIAVTSIKLGAKVTSGASFSAPLPRGWNSNTRVIGLGATIYDGNGRVYANNVAANAGTHISITNSTGRVLLPGEVLTIEVVSTGDESLQATDFSTLYSDLKTIARVVRYLDSINFTGIVNAPAGTFYVADDEESVVRGLDMSRIFLKGAGVSSTTIITSPANTSSFLYWNCALRMGGLKIASHLEMRQCEFTNEDVDTAQPLTVTGQVIVTRQSRAIFENAILEGGIAVNYSSQANVDGAQIYVSAADAPFPATGIIADGGSFVTAQQASAARRISNPNAVATATAIMATAGSIVIAVSNRIGNTGQTIDVGCAVYGDSYINSGSVTYSGTVTTQVSQTANTRTNEGLIAA